MFSMIRVNQTLKIFSVILNQWLIRLQICCEKYVNIWFGFQNKSIVRSVGKIHEKLSTFCSSYGLIYIDNRNRGLDLCQDNPYLL